VAKLFAQVRPDLALFGEKDWQQLAIIRRMARDLDLTQPSADRIVGVQIVRESDGLAMSSRNRYLSSEDRARAGALPRLMQDAIRAIGGGSDVLVSLEQLRVGLLKAGFSSIDYAELADAQSLRSLRSLGTAPARLFVAARIGGTRLIDNMPVS
jgi:pantoate--beta-alanine ligase